MPKNPNTFSQEMMLFLNKVSKELSSSLDLKVTLGRLSKLTVPKMADWFAIELLDENMQLQQLTVNHVDPEKVKWAKELRRKQPPGYNEDNSSARVIMNGKSEIYPQVTDEMVRANSKNEEEYKLIKKIGICSVMIVPLVVRGKPFGAMSFIMTEDSGRNYEKKDLLLAEEFAYRAAMALENARLYKQAQDEIEDRKAAEHRLEISQKAGHIGTYEIDLVNKTVYWSAELERLFGLEPGSFGGTHDAWFEFVHPEDKDQIMAERDRQLAKGNELELEFRIIRPDKTVHWIFSKGRYFRDKNGNPTKTVGINMDITERKRLERQKDEFLSIASHELKTPLTSIKAFVQILQRYFARPEYQDSVTYLSKVDHQVDKLTKLVQDLLDVSKLQTGKLEYNEDVFNFDELVSETVEEMQPITDQHEIIHEGKANIQVFTDKYRIGQVLTNFISNAIKYSPEGGKIIVQTKHERNLVTVSVKDFGIGIPEDKKQFLFQRFYRVMDKKRESFPGLGLGLFISSEIVRRQKGKIWFESTEGKGSTFSFSLPINIHKDQILSPQLKAVRTN